jgi:probable phosphoglycerate mutase
MVDTAMVTNGPGPDLLLVRHGETVWTKTGQHTSRTDLPLTETGEQQALALRRRLAGWEFALVLTSPMARAKRTAELAGLPPAEVDPDLCEWDYGKYEGRTTDQIRVEAPGWTIWRGPWPGGETIEQVVARADRLISRIRTLPPGATAVVVGHGHMLRVLAARWLGASPDAGRWLALGTASLSALGWERETAVVLHWNELAAPPD